MANVINKKTKQILYSIHTPDYQEPEWMIINNKHIPIRPSKYWKIVDNEVLEMTEKEKAVIDYIEPIPEPNPVEKIYTTDEKIDGVLSVLLNKYPKNLLLKKLQTPIKNKSFAISYEV